MTIANTKVVDSTSKYIVQSKGIGSETDQIVVDAEELTNDLLLPLASSSASTTIWSVSLPIPFD